MPPNPAFRRAAHSLAHPVTLAAIALLLLNDHWLRWAQPSWLTGKLGDFTWLVFAPFIAALLMAWLIPARWRHQETAVGVLSIALIGLWFALAKTVPFVHELTATAWNALIGWQGSLRLDPTDLLTLPALLVSAWVWARVKPRPINWKPLAYVAFGLGIVATLASDGPYFVYNDSGIVTLCQVDDRLITVTERAPTTVFNGGDPENSSNYTVTQNWNVFSSTDGGLSWREEAATNYQLPTQGCTDQLVRQLTDPRNSTIQYRWQPGGPIERSQDSGSTWAIDYPLAEYQQDVRRNYNHYSSAGFDIDGYSRAFVRGPAGGLIDRDTGNLVLAMSWDGVLVRTPSGEWRWVNVGQAYELADLANQSKIVSILFFELWLAGALGFLILCTAAVYIRHHHVSLLRQGWLDIGWFMWIVLMLLMAVNRDNFVAIGLASLASLVVLAIPQMLISLWDLLWNFRSYVLRIAAMSALAAGLFLLPFILWARGTIPPYNTAWVFALLLAACGVLTAYRALKPVLPIAPPPEKPK